MRVLVAMSGGVDSSVAAARLVAAGHEVTGATLKLWGGSSDSGCCAVSDVDDARRVADQLGVAHHTFGYAEEFDTRVVGPYVEAHLRGETPNPCVECNRHLKFGALLARADRLGFDAVATGHHARVVARASGRRAVGRGADRAKDQSYVLAGLDHDRLGRIVFPVGDSAKADLRAEAAGLGLRTAAKPDSQDVCFITRRDGRRAFLAARAELTPGVVVDTEGTTVGRVDAVEAVTLGQRRGLGLPGGTAPRFVLSSDPATATVVVGSEDDLRVAEQPLTDLGLADGRLDGLLGRPLDWQVSAHGRAHPGTLHVDDDGAATVAWAVPQRRVAPGQVVVGYRDDVVAAWAAATRASRQPATPRV